MMKTKPSGQTIVSAQKLKEFCVKVLMQSSGMPLADARTVTDNLIFANLRGTDTHGITRLGVYLELLEAGVATVRHKVQIIKDTQLTALVDADNALGQIGAQFGMELAIQRACQHGIGWVLVGNSGHIGALAYWAMMALQHDMVGICFTSTASIMAAHGSRENTLGNNPLAIAAPSSGPMPLVLDMALSVAARGHLAVAKRENKSIPLDWAMDAQGVPTTDPAKGLEGSVLPIGGYKGSGLSMMLEVLTGILSGSPFGPQKGSLVPPDCTKPLGLSHAFVALKIDNYIPVPAFKKRIDALIDEIKNSAPSLNVHEVLVPNDKEFRIEQERKKKGIPLSSTLIKELKSFSDKYDIPFPT